MNDPVFPFSAIVAQDDMKLALQLAAIDPSLGGVLAFGDRGTGKTTAMRGLAALLPPLTASADCLYNCDPQEDRSLCPECRRGRDAGTLSICIRTTPVIDLPLGCTEDRVIGALDMEKALTIGVRAFQPGLLAAAHRGFLYIDEVNLLEDHLVDILLDVSASGVNVVERDGLSIRHAARFILIGSGNPEEGELRPQLLDRFGLSVEVTTPGDIEQRMRIIRARDDYERDPAGFVARHDDADARIRERLMSARDMLEHTAIEEPSLRRITELCLALGTDGLRGELTLMRASRACAALQGNTQVTETHIARVAPMALSHRLRRDPLDESGSASRVHRAMDSLGLAA